MINKQTILWHDYETFGADPQRDRPVQFAGIRTDLNLNIIDDPFVVYCKPPFDYLPNPEACLITGITPQIAENEGVCEAKFISQIDAQLTQPNTCTVGFNNLRFDDEVTRNCLYRNFYDPYAREWQNGNSRWDLIDVVRAARALRPEGINWPINEEGNATIKLDQLTQVNGIEHESAHDALSDVYATLAIAKLVKSAQPKLYQFLFNHRAKSEANKLLQLGEFKPLVHVSGKYSTAKNCLAVVLPICRHPGNANGIIVYDLSVDPEPLIHLSVSDIQRRIFASTADMPDGAVRIPLKTVHANKCPVLAPIAVIRANDEQRLGLDLQSCYRNIERLKSTPDLTTKVSTVFDNTDSWARHPDPEMQIYSGGFFSDQDKKQMDRIRKMSPEQLSTTKFTFSDKRLAEMLFRYRARNWPESLSKEELKSWQAFCCQRLTNSEGANYSLGFRDYFQALKQLSSNSENKQDIIEVLYRFGAEKKAQLNFQ